MNAIHSIGCIGCGNMGAALLEGFAKKDKALSLYGYNRSPAKVERLAPLGIIQSASPDELARTADLVIVAVKPYQVPEVLSKIREALRKDTLLLSVAAGIPKATLARESGTARVIRCMPNTPATVGKGIFALAFAQEIPSAIQTAILDLFSLLGLALPLPESKFAAFSSLIGAGPAYVVTMMQGMVQAGITLGFTEKDSRRMVTALFEGTAVWAQAKEDHLMALRDAVSSPAGLTIEGVNVLERKAFAGTTVDAVLAANARALAMEKS
ncbi:MAG: pyrroline-5-carboxylate reductase [Desulfovibrionaceae bacterium]|nr:pyrroline-5-carboxylate reductase [Desulfovibrionaceae bacterium]